MNNSLLTKLSNHGLSLLSNEVKDKATRYILIGTTSFDDKALIAALDDNDVNNSMTYEMLANNNWIGYEGPILQKYYDRNNFLTFDFELPKDTTLNIYVYGFALIDVSNIKKEVVSITRSPSIFNKVKNTSALFSIKLTFGQEDINSQFRDNIHDSQFVDFNYLCKASGTNGTNILEADIDMSASSIGTKIKCKGVPVETVIVDNNGTDLSLQKNQFRINRNLTEDITNEAVFVIETVYQQSDFMTKAEFNKWQVDHNHNTQYYLKDETVVNSFKLDGKDSSFYVSTIDYNKLKDELKSKLDTSGGYISGSLLSRLNKSTKFRSEEFVPLFHIEKLIADLKEYVEVDYNDGLMERIKRIVGSINLLNSTDKSNIVSALNEVIDNIGPIQNLNYSDKKIVSVLNFLLSSIGNSQISNGKSIIENIESFLLNKADKDAESIFTVRPKIKTSDNDLSQLDKSSILNYSNVESLLSNIRRTVEINLLNKPKDKTYPIVFNESGEKKYTNSIIYNEINSNLDNSVVRLEIYGTGSVGGKYASFLKAYHSCRGVESFVKKIYVPSQSSAVVVYLRGGSKYTVELNGTDMDPIVVDNSYTLKNTATIVAQEQWIGTDKIQAGNWVFNRSLEINIDKNLNPHFSYDLVP